MFCDSFEIIAPDDAIYWSEGLLEEFKKFKGYDLTRYFPAIWWDIGKLTPRIRYDLNEFLHHIGIEAFFKPFLGWCRQYQVDARIQTYHRFPTEVVQSAGITHRPECEMTPTRPYFQVEMNVRKSVSSGAHLYGRPIVSAEAYTFIHRERYRTTLEELKITGDAFLRDGVTQLYNMGYSYSPEKDVSPTRSVPWAPVINHSNIWWKHYRCLSSYQAHCCYLLRESEFVPDIAMYSPYANSWAKKVIKGFTSRNMAFENLGRDLGTTLVANGYDFDIVNEDILLNHARIEAGMIKVQGMEYKFLILPNIEVIPVKTMEFIRSYVREGGVVIALDNLPTSSGGLENYQNRDKKVRDIVKELFTPARPRVLGKNRYGRGYTYHFQGVIKTSWYPQSRVSALDNLIRTLQTHLARDFSFEGMEENPGLTFLHRKENDLDIYFVTNLQDKPSTVPITFRVKNKFPEEWNPDTGKISPIHCYQRAPSRTRRVGSPARN